MNATAEPLPFPRATSVVVDAGLSGIVAPLEPAAEPAVRDGVLEIPGEMALYHGGRLSGVRVAWRWAGPANAPVICALGGMAANRRVCETERSGWWSDIAGPNQALDTHRYRILSFDYLGACDDTTGPLPSQSFPSVSSYDQAELLLRLLDHLGIKTLRAIAGGSYGGMVALAFGERHPERVTRLIVLCAADRPHPLATAWRSVQRAIVRLAAESGRPLEGLKLARALAMSTCCSGEEFAARFAGPPTLESNRFLFPVERHLLARGGEFATRHRPESFVCLSESIDLHRVDASRIFVPTLAIGVREDQLVPSGDVRAMVARLGAGRFHEISSLYGHDAFVKESQQLRGLFAAALE
ncbi:MAG: homoserine O-succinyltransferase MetX [Steroidobacteraceae bacterium]